MVAGPINRALLESFYQNAGDVYSDLKTEGAFDVIADGVDDNWDYTTSLVANGTLSPYPSFLSRQAIINGNFDVWQRGTSFTNPASNSYGADRWKINFGVDGGTLPTTIVHSSQQLNVGDIANSFYFYRINVNGAGSGFGTNSIYRFQQIIENGTRFLCGNGKKVTVSFYAKSDIVGKRIGLSCSQTYGTGGSPAAGETLNGNTFTLTTTWTKYTVTFTTNTLVGKTFGTNNDDALFVDFVEQWGSGFNSRFNTSTAETSFVGAGNIDIAQVQVNAGNVALPFQPRSFADELAACQRYYNKTFTYGTAPANNAGRSGALVAKLLASGDPVARYHFPVNMRTNPTVSFFSPQGGTAGQWRDDNNTVSGTTAVGFDVSEKSVVISNSNNSLSAGLYEIHATADAEL